MLQFTVKMVYGADGLKINVMLRTVPTLYALKGDFFPEEYAEKQLKEKQLRNLLKK